MAATRSRASGSPRRWKAMPAWPSSAAGSRSARKRPPRRLDRDRGRAYRDGMDNRDQVERIRALVTRVDQLVERTRQLQEENQSLRQQHEQVSGERSQLLVKNEQARSRVEAMIARLKSLEQHT